MSKANHTNELKEVYRGHEIKIGREKSLGGWEMAYYTIFRISDGYECMSDFTEDESPLPELIAALRDRIDIELNEIKPWGEEEQSSETYNAETARECTPEPEQHLSGQSRQASDLQRLAMLCKRSIPNSPEKPMCSPVGDCCHCKKNRQPDDSNQPQYEHLSLALPIDPVSPVQIYGSVDCVDAHFVMRAELLLSALRLMELIWVNKAPHVVQSLFDQLLREANALLCAYGCALKANRNHEASQSQGEE